MKVRERICKSLKGSADMQSTVIAKQQTRRHPGNVEIAAYVDGRLDPNKDSIEPLYCEDKG